MNTVDKNKENQIIIDDIKNNGNKIIEQVYSQFVIQPAYKRGDLQDAVKIILEINEVLTSDKVNNVDKIKKKYFKALEGILTAKISEKNTLRGFKEYIYSKNGSIKIFIYIFLYFLIGNLLYYQLKDIIMLNFIL